MNTTDSPNPSSDKKPRKYTPEEWRQRLLALGVKDATFDRTTPRAFELPASGVSPTMEVRHSKTEPNAPITLTKTTP
jgi:hypothetical protein